MRTQRINPKDIIVGQRGVGGSSEIQSLLRGVKECPDGLDVRSRDGCPRVGLGRIHVRRLVREAAGAGTAGGKTQGPTPEIWLGTGEDGEGNGGQGHQKVFGEHDRCGAETMMGVVSWEIFLAPEGETWRPLCFL